MTTLSLGELAPGPGATFLAPVGPPGTGKSFISQMIAALHPSASWTSIDHFKGVFRAFASTGRDKMGRARQYESTFDSARQQAQTHSIVVVETGCTRASHCRKMLELPGVRFLVPLELCAEAPAAVVACMSFRAFIDATRRVQSTPWRDLLWLALRFEPFVSPPGHTVIRYQALASCPVADPPNLVQILAAVERDGPESPVLLAAIAKYDPLIVRADIAVGP